MRRRRNTAGSDAYKVVSWKPGVEVVYERNDGWVGGKLLCDRVVVMQAGQIVEQGPTGRVMERPQAGYTRDWLAAIPHPPLQAESGS